jgi:hypothetical protein
MEDSASSSTDARPSHLCIILHGLVPTASPQAPRSNHYNSFWGDNHQVRNLLVALRERFSEDKLGLFVPKCNEDNLTYDGIDVCAERLLQQLEKMFERKLRDATFQKLSLVGYSLGGLITRYLAGLLFAHTGGLIG